MKLFEEFFDDIEQDELIDSSEDVFDDKSEQDNWDKEFKVIKDGTYLNRLNLFLDNCAYITDHEVEKENYTIKFDGYMTVKEAIKFCKIFGYYDFGYLVSPVSIDKEFIQNRFSNGVLNLSGVKFEDSVFIVKHYIDDYKSIEYIDLRNADTSKLKYLSFESLTSLKQIYGIEDIDTSNLRSTRDMFGDCKSLKELNINTWDVSNVRDMSGMFSNCNFEELNLNDWNVSNVIDMSIMFNCCHSLEELNINNWNVSNVNSMKYMFNYCESLKELNINTWDVSNVNSMKYMFNYCESLNKLNINNWDVSNVKHMDDMFCFCKSLKELNLSNWDVSNVKHMDDMFFGCKLLNTLYLNDSFKPYLDEMNIRTQTKIIYK